MTTLFSTAMTASQTPVIPRGRVALVALWLTQIALAAMFVFAGGLKLTGAPGVRCAPAHSHDGRRRLHPSVYRRRVCGARNRAAHRFPRDRVGTS
jgi:hypothetical protein